MSGKSLGLMMLTEKEYITDATCSYSVLQLAVNTASRSLLKPFLVFFRRRSQL